MSQSRKGQVGLEHNYPKAKNGKTKANKKKESKPKKWSEKQIVKLADKSGIDSQKMMVRYHQRLITNMNPYNGIFNPVVFQIVPSGMDNLLPNFPSLTNSQRRIWIEYITVYCIFTENDLELNSTNRQFIRNMLVYKDDETDASTSEVSGMFVYTGTGSLTNMEMSLNAVLPQNGKIYPRQDSQWIPYDADASNALGSGVESDLNYKYPYKRFRKTLKIRKEFQIDEDDAGSLIDFHVPTLALFYTGVQAESPDCHAYFHMYYKVLA